MIKEGLAKCLFVPKLFRRLQRRLWSGVSSKL